MHSHLSFPTHFPPHTIAKYIASTNIHMCIFHIHVNIHNCICIFSWMNMLCIFTYTFHKHLKVLLGEQISLPFKELFLSPLEIILPFPLIMSVVTLHLIHVPPLPLFHNCYFSHFRTGYVYKNTVKLSYLKYLPQNYHPGPQKTVHFQGELM